jgi:hypothetical protein
LLETHAIEPLRIAHDLDPALHIAQQQHGLVGVGDQVALDLLARKLRSQLVAT